VRELHAAEVAAPRLVHDLAPWIDRGGVLGEQAPAAAGERA
jgi:hypothetical protein